MTSTIISETIDAEYPVAGVDNDTQGFRDNFQIIKDNFAKAGSEITDLQDTTVKINENNNFGSTGKILINPILSLSSVQFKRSTMVINNDSVSNNLSIYVPDGLYQEVRIVIDSSIDEQNIQTVGFNFTDWPLREDSNIAVTSMRLAVTSTRVDSDVTVNLNFDTATTTKYATSAIYANDTATTPIGYDNTVRLLKSTSQDNPMIFEIWTPDSGQTLFVECKGQYV